MELLTTAAIAGLGYLFNDDKKKKEVSPAAKPTKIFDSKRIAEVADAEVNIADINFSKVGSGTHIVPDMREFIKVDGKGGLPLEYSDKPVINDWTTGEHGEVRLMSGQIIDKKNFKFNGMQPYAKKITQNMDEYATQRKFEMFSGQDSNYRNKTELETGGIEDAWTKGVNTPYGMPSTTAEFRSRYVVGNKHNNVRPFEQIWVGPGLGDGYTGKPSGGFQQARSRDLVMPKTVDELRTLNNPKLSYKSRIIGGKSHISKPPKIGIVQKNRPDRFWEHGHKRLFTTVGAITGPKQRSRIVLKYTNRKHTSRDYVAPAYNGATKRVVRPRVRLSDKVVHKGDFIRNMSLGGKHNDNYDYGKISHNPKETLRSKVNKWYKTFFGNAKETTRGNMIYNPNMTTKTTGRETLENDTRLGNYSGANTAGWVRDPADLPKRTIKETTFLEQYLGAPHKERHNGGYKLVKHNPSTTHREMSSREYFGSAQEGNLGAYDITKVDVADTNRAQNGSTNYLGGIQSASKKQRSYLDAYNMLIKSKRVSKGHMPTPQGTKYTNGKECINATTVRNTDDYNKKITDRGIVPDKVYNSLPKAEICSVTKPANKLDNFAARYIDPIQTEQFRKNPYSINY